MKLNHENAMKLWNERYGKANKVIDFAGREIDKGSYGNRNSRFGWNLDHIVPQSNGGNDSESNLLICHILTNDEKSNHFPTFKANNKNFEIVKVDEVYEIREIKPTKDKLECNNKTKTYEHSTGFTFTKNTKENGEFKVTINIESTKKTAYSIEPAILEFIKKLFEY